MALPQPTTAGMPSSRATMAACQSGAPTSVITAAARGKSGVQPTLVIVVTSTSPGRNAAPSAASSMTRTKPSTTPADPGKPRTATSASVALPSMKMSDRRCGSAAQVYGLKVPRISVG